MTLPGCLTADIGREVIAADERTEANDCLSPAKRGIVLSFDDSINIDSWNESRPLFEQYNATATFFVDRWDDLTSEEIEILRVLKEEGHEIGFHGTNHRDYFQFTDGEKNESDYFHEEIIPGLTTMRGLGFNATSYAYPLGSREPVIDKLLLEEFVALRGVNSRPNGSHPWITDCLDFGVYRALHLKTEVNNQSSLDYKNKQITMADELLLAGNYTLNIFGHGIGKGNYVASNETLVEVLEMANKHNLTYLNFSELGY